MGNCVPLAEIKNGADCIALADFEDSTAAEPYANDKCEYCHHYVPTPSGEIVTLLN